MSAQSSLSAAALPPVHDRKEAMVQARQALGARQPQQALVMLDRLITADANDSEAVHYAGVALNMLGQTAQALLLFRRALQLDPANPSIRQNMILPLLEADRTEEAVAMGREAVRLNPARAGARQNFILALTRAGKWDEAALAAESFIAISPDDVNAWTQLGHVRSQQKHHDLAEALLRRALQVDPGNIEALYNIGVVLQTTMRDELSLEYFLQALAKDPAHRGARLNLGVAYRNLGRVPEALQVWRASPVAPEQWPELAYNIACARMLAGEWAESWADYELRLVTMGKVPGNPEPDSPQWDGTPMPDQTLLVVHEQGLGDMVQFIRLLPSIADRVGRLVFVCQPAIYGLLKSFPLFSENRDGRMQILRQDGPLPPHDKHISLMSLPALLNLSQNTVPRRAPYLFADPAKVQLWATALDERDRTQGRRPFRVGIAWQGNPNAAVERGRSVPLADLAKIFDVADVRFFALHKDVGLEQVASSGLGGRLEIVAEHLKDFSDTAALMANLDLVISVDTSIVHVAGALGKPVWLLNRHIAEWRWGLTGRMTPWYPTMQIYRQHVAKDWAGLAERVARDLEVLVSLRRAPGVAEGHDGNALLNHALALHQSARMGEALPLYRQLASSYPNNGKILNLLGMCVFEHGHRHKSAALEALPIVLRSAALSPNEPDFFSNLGILLDHDGPAQDRLEALGHALAIDPDHHASLLSMANREITLGRAANAVPYVERVIQKFPKMASAFGVYAAALVPLGRLQDAERAMVRALELDPTNARLLVQYGAVLNSREKFADAKAAWEKALVYDPRNADAYSNMGVEERNRGEVGLGTWYNRRAVEIDPNHAEGWCNLGIGTMEIEREAEARAAFRRAIALKPHYSDAMMALGMSLMNDGNYAEALPLYEHRVFIEKLGIGTNRPRLPLWQGEDLRAKKIVILAEQGFGDSFQFIRYANELKKLGAEKVYVGCRKMLARVLSTATGVDAIIHEGDRLPQADYCVYMMSLPLRLGTRVETIPAEVPYLKAEPELTVHWAQKLNTRPGFRVGINWQGNPNGPIDKGRSIPLKMLKPLADIPGVRLISIQVGAGNEQIAQVKDIMEVEHLGPEFNAGPDAFLDSAAVMMNLDLIISVDTAPIHLAGALGRPAWVLTKANSEWRWLRNRSDSPWYPQTRIFRRVEREPEAEPWGGLVQRLETELKALVAGDRSRIYEKAMPVVDVPPQPPVEERFKAALALHLAGKTDEARTAYSEIINDHPTFPDAFHMLGALALQSFAYPRALIFLREAERLGLNTPEFRTNKAIALRNLNKVDEAESVLRGIIAEKPTAEALTTLGNLLRDADRFEEARAAYAEAIVLRPELAKAHRGLGNALKDLGRANESVAAFDAAVKLTPNDPELLLDRAHGLLLGGDYKAGFEAYEARWSAMEMIPRSFAAPRWAGQSLKGKTLLIHGEQGFGDNIQFCRFAPEIAAKAAHAIIEVRGPVLELVQLLDFKGAKVSFVEQGQALPAYDFEVPFMSLPRFVDLGKALPGKVPYFHISAMDAKRWRDMLPKNGKKNIGLVWQGNQRAKVEKGRSIGLDLWRDLLDLPGCNFISLQKDFGLDQLQGFDWANRITLLPEPFYDFSETAALISNLDDVVSVDTAVCHLAGSLGVPTSVLVKFNNDWRWQVGRSDTPWYPQMTVYRQLEPGDWATPMRALTKQLSEKVRQP